MNIRTFIITLLICCSFGKLSAQLPETSTKTDPIWYFIQVKGSGERADRIFQAGDDAVWGIQIAPPFSETELNRCLWRFEKTDDLYTIYNRHNDYKLSLDTLATLNLLTASVKENPTVEWEITTNGDYFNFTSKSKTSTDRRNNRSLFQTDNTNNRNYVIMTVLSTSSSVNTDNALFHFKKYDSSLPQVSESEDIWYYINSANPLYTNKCITDINAAQSNLAKFEVQDKQSDNHYQQWKVIRPINATEDINHFMNRATGNIIQTRADYNGYFNAQSTNSVENSNGWSIEYLFFDQFSISGKDDDGIDGYLNVSSTLEPAQSLPEIANFINSSFSWTFEKVGTNTSIPEIEKEDPFSNVRIYVQNRRIIVEGADDYRVTHISGIRISKDGELPVGVYLVTIKNKTKTVLVK